MYIPAYVKKHLTTPESLAFESKRRGLKATLSSTREAVRNHRTPVRARNVMDFEEAIQYEKVKDSHAHAVRTILKENGKRESVEEAKARLAASYAAHLDWHTAKLKSQKIREQLINAVEAARKEYEDFINQTKESDLE